MEAVVKAVPVKKEKKRKKFFKKPTKLEVLSFFLILIAIVAVLWPFCTTRIESGYVGVYYSTFFGGTKTDKVYGEGLHLVAPWDNIISYDTRIQSQSYKIKALAKGGLSVDVELTAVYAINRNEAPMLHKTIGSDYTTKLINPAVLSSVRSVVGKLTQTELYDADITQIQDDALKQIKVIFQDKPLTISSVLVREIVFPETVSTAINAKFVAEQNVLEERYRVLQAVENYKQTYVDGEATRFEQALISEGMTDAYLRYLGIEATLALAESDNAKLVIIGDKDGLPLILNPDTLLQTDEQAEGLTIDEYRVEEGEETRPDQFQDNYDRLIGLLDAISEITDDVNEKFADAPVDIDTTLPQEGQVPVTDDNDQ
jgi:regulator of protease activity HflC (stomatin/prohibitin superfamily)